MLQRPGLEKGRHVPVHSAFGLKKLDDEQLRKAAESARAWVQAGMAEDAKK